MQREGSIVGMSTRVNKTWSDGMVTLTITINGGDGTLTLVLDGTSQTYVVTQATGIDTYAPGDLVGVHLTTDEDFNGFFADVAVFVQGQE